MNAIPRGRMFRRGDEVPPVCPYGVGDLVVCVNNPDGIVLDVERSGRGAGWTLGWNLRIGRITLGGAYHGEPARYILWPEGDPGACGVYYDYVQLVSKVHQPIPEKSLVDFQTFVKYKKENPK